MYHISQVPMFSLKIAVNLSINGQLVKHLKCVEYVSAVNSVLHSRYVLDRYVHKKYILYDKSEGGKLEGYFLNI
jgi:hypothetical protein